MSRFTSHSTRPVRRVRPNLEALEARWCPSTAGITQIGQTLHIEGDGANDTILVSDNGHGAVTASMSSTKGSQTKSATGINDIQIEGGGGNDTINYMLTGTMSQQESFMLCLDHSSSQATYDFSAGLSNATLAFIVGGAASGSTQLTTKFGAISNSRVNLTDQMDQGNAVSHFNFNGALSNALVTVNVSSGAGNNQVFATLGSATNSNMQFLVHFGSGSNLFNLQETGSLQNSVVHYDIDGSANATGANTFTFNCSNVNVDMTSRLNLESYAGSGNDSVTLNYSGVMDGELDMNLDGGAGNDIMSATLTLNKGGDGRINAYLYGGPGNDVETFDVYDNSNPGGKSMLAHLNAELFAVLGHNTISATSNVEVMK